MRGSTCERRCQGAVRVAKESASVRGSNTQKFKSRAFVRPISGRVIARVVSKGARGAARLFVPRDGLVVSWGISGGGCVDNATRAKKSRRMPAFRLLFLDVFLVFLVFKVRDIVSRMP